MNSTYSKGGSTARSSTMSYASSTIQNDTQSMVLDAPRGMMIIHIIYCVLPQLLCALALLLNFQLMMYYVSPVSACYFVYMVYFFRLLFGAVSQAFAEVNFIQVQRYMDAQQRTPCSMQFTYSIILKTLVAIILIAVTGFAFKEIGVLENNVQQSLQNKQVFMAFLLMCVFTFCQWEECKAILTVQHRILQFYLTFLCAPILQLMFSYMYFLLSPRYSEPLFSIISSVCMGIPLWFTLANQTNLFKSSGNAELFVLSFKVIMPIKWSMIGLILVKVLEFLLDTVDLPLLQFFVVYFEKKQDGSYIDQLRMSSVCLYVIYFEMASAFNKSVVSFLMRFVGINNDYRMYSRILGVVTKDMVICVVGCVCYCVVLFLMINPVTKLFVTLLNPDVKAVEALSRTFQQIRSSGLLPVLELPYQICVCLLKLTGAYKGNLYLLSVLAVLAVDALLLGLYPLNYHFERSTDILLYSSVFKFVLGCANYVWFLVWLKRSKNSAETVEPKVLNAAQEISEVSVRQAVNISASKVDSQLYTTDTEVESVSVVKPLPKQQEVSDPPKLKYNMTTDFIGYMKPPE